MIKPRRRLPKPQLSAEEIQAAEHEAARQRILELAEAERTPLDDITQAVPERRWRREQP